jgi:flavin reductase (DIM6/NTAB) family NADH-FMN oxidoreductase RutF
MSRLMLKYPKQLSFFVQLSADLSSPVERPGYQNQYVIQSPPSDIRSHAKITLKLSVANTIPENITMEKITIGPMPYMSVMPTLLVGTNVEGKANYMTAAWATVACMAPPMVCVAINKARFTVKGIDENKTFSLNVPSAKQVIETDHCGLVSGAHEDKSQVFNSFYGKLKTAPLAEECPVNIECKLFKSVDCGSHLLYIGEVVEIHVDKASVTDGKPDIAKLDPIVYAQAAYWHAGMQIDKAFSAGKKYPKK